MKAGKAYISSLGTTGLLVASSVLLLTVVGALVAFDRWPAGASSADADAVVIGSTERANAARGSGADRRRARPERRRAARARGARRSVRAQRRAAQRAVQADGGAVGLRGSSPASAPPAVDAVPTGGGSGGGSSGGGGAGVPAGGDRPSGIVADVVSQVDGQAGQALGEIGETAEGALAAPLETLGPGVAP